nr:hypothetical protein [Caldilineaceae bacterium]
MPDRKYTYKVEIDAAQAKAQAEELRRTLTAMLDDIAPQQRSGIAQAIQQAQKPAQDLNRALEETQKRVRDLRNEYERMNQTAAAAASRGTQRSRANFGTYVEEVRKAAGDEAAGAARRTGRATNIGNLGAEFKDDETGRYLEAERDALRARQEANEKMRFTAAEKRQLAELESQLTQAELAEVQVRQRLAQEQKADADRLIAAWESSGDGLDAFTADIMGASDRLETEIRQMAEDETQLLESTARANQRLSALIEQQDADMRRAAAKAQGTIMQAGAGATGAGVYSQQTAITISQASAANAERFAAAMRDAAEASERMEHSRMSSNVRGYELDIERERQKIRRDSAKSSAVEVEQERAAARARIQSVRQAEVEQKRLTASTEREARKRAQAEEKATLDAISQAKRQAQQHEAEQRKQTIVVEREARRRAQAEEKATRQAEADQKKLTSATEREARKRTQAEQRATRRPFSVSGAMNNLDMWTGMAAGGLGAFGVAQLGQQAYDSARQGAVLQRQQATFNEFAKRMGVDAAAVVAAVQKASNATITEFDAMGLASQVLASKFSQSSTDIAGDLGTVTAFARRASQIFVDEQGQAMGVQEVFGRLVKFAREGNKELVDQFGLSNQLIAEAMGTTVDGLASAQGATLRWQGLVKVLNGELERLGPAAMTTAERFEQSAARVETAKQRIQMATAAPVAGIAEGVAGVVEFGMTAMGGSGLDTVRRQIEENAKFYAMTEQGATAVIAARDALQMYDAAMQTNSESAASYAQELTNLLSLLVKQGTLLPDNVASLDTLAKRLDLVALGLDTYGLAMQVTTMEGVRQSEAIFALVRTMATYENLYMQGGVTLEQYSEQMVALAARMREAADAGGYLSSQLADTYTMIGPLAQGFERRAAGAAAEERTPFLDPEQSAWAPPEGLSERQVAAMYELQQWREQQNEALRQIQTETMTPAMEDVRVGLM